MPEILVVGVGVAGWVGGTDLFLDMARRLSDDPEIELWWVGRRSRGAARRLDLDAELMGVQRRVVWSGELPSTTTTTVLVVPARTGTARDAVVEAADPAVPTLCFALPGVADPATAGRVDVVEFPDTAAMADRVRSISDLYQRRAR